MEESGQWLEVAVGVMAFSIFISGLFRQGTPDGWKPGEGEVKIKGRG